MEDGREIVPGERYFMIDWNERTSTIRVGGIVFEVKTEDLRRATM